MDTSEKPFKTIDEQIELLESRNVFFGKDRYDYYRNFLLKENYYSVVNGYKDAFLDKQKSHELGHDYYKDGTVFAQLAFLYMFDRGLRETTLSAIMEAETIIKTSLVYAFSFYNREENDAYLDPASYCKIRDYPNKKDYTRNLIKLLNALQNAHDNKSKPYISHYLKEHGHVPLWVISRLLTFGNISAFFDLQNRNVKSATCINICKATEKDESSLKPNRLKEIFRILVPFRNICAHGERLYCTKVGKRDYFTYKDLVFALIDILPADRVNDFLLRILSRFKYLEISNELKEDVLKAMNITEKEINDLVEMTNK